MMTRRRLLGSAIALSALGRVTNAVRAMGLGEASGQLRVLPGAPSTAVPKNFMGLGYEESSVARVGLLSASNAPYVQLVRNLGTGVLRAGGIVADFTSYSSEGKPQSEPKSTVVTHASLEQLRGFLDAVGWTAIWSVNFGRGTLEEAIAEARDVAHVLGPRLLAIELGNEVENYGHGKAPLRPSSYSYEDYRAEYTRWHKAILSAVPGLRFAAPDTAASVDWVERMASDARGDVQLLTTHYYRGDQRLGTPDQLLQADPGLKAKLARLHAASARSGIPWRMCEMNSFFGGGRPGLSDTLAGALWTLDVMLLLAQCGCAGVNMETGVNQLGFLSSYSPIRNDEAGQITAGAPYYGMLAFAQAAANATMMFPAEIDADGLNLTAYALGRGARPSSFVLINKTADRSFRVPLQQLRMNRGSILRLTGRSPDSGDGVMLGGAAVDSAGRWSARGSEPVRNEVVVEASSAVLIQNADAAAG